MKESNSTSNINTYLYVKKEENTYMLTFELIRADVNSHRSLIHRKWEKKLKDNFPIGSLKQNSYLYRLFDSVEYLCVLIYFHIFYMIQSLYDSLHSLY